MAVSTFAAPSGVQPYEQIFTSSGTWTVPAGVKTCELTILGGSNYGGSYGSAAGGYYKGLVDVTGLSTVAVTVGSGGTSSSTSGGESSFGTLIAAPGGGAGSYYKPSLPGFATGAVSVVTGPFEINTGGGNWYTGSYINSTYSQVTSNGRIYIYSNGNPGGQATSINGTTWVTSTNPFLPVSNAKTVFGNGVYVASYLENASYNNVYYSNDGITYTNSNLAAGYVCDVAYGPAGFIVSNQSTIAAKSTNGSTWTAVTTSGLPSGAYVLQGTSSYYYAFAYTGYTSTAYRSTDGVTWTSFNMNTATSNMQVKSATSYNNKVYVLNSTNMQIIDGTTVTTSPVGVGANVFFQHNSIYFTTGSYTYYSVTSPTVPVSTNGFGIPQSGQGTAAVTSTGIAFGVSANNSTNVAYCARGYAGQAGFTWSPITSSAMHNGTPGVLSAGSHSPSTTYSYPTAGLGNEDGWGCGYSGGDVARYRGSYGSGAPASTNGNPGVVRVRWWA